MVLLDGDDEVFDYELELFANVATVLDRHIVATLEREMDPELADQFGLFDVAEHATGLGFAAAQVYLSATSGFLRIGKQGALNVGPTHSATGKPIAEIVNAAANHWKHSTEFPERETPREKREELFSLLGCSGDDDYPLSNVLRKLTPSRDAPLSSLVPLLAAWRDGLQTPDDGQGRSSTNKD
jgi:hypothetical protein